MQTAKSVLELIVVGMIVLLMIGGTIALAVYYIKKYWGGVVTALKGLGFVVACVAGVLIVAFTIAGGMREFVLEVDVGKMLAREQTNSVYIASELTNFSARVDKHQKTLEEQAQASNVNFAHMKKLLDDATKRLAELEKAKP